MLTFLVGILRELLTEMISTSNILKRNLLIIATLFLTSLCFGQTRYVFNNALSDGDTGNAANYVGGAGVPGTNIFAVDTMEVDCDCSFTSPYEHLYPMVIEVTSNDHYTSNDTLRTDDVTISVSSSLLMENHSVLYFDKTLEIDGTLEGNIIAERGISGPSTLNKTISGTGTFQANLLSTGTSTAGDISISMHAQIDSLLKIESGDIVRVTDTLTLKGHNGDNGKILNDGVGSFLLEGGVVNTERSFINPFQAWVVTTVSDTVRANEYMTSDSSIVWTNHNHDSWPFGNGVQTSTNTYLWDEASGFVELVDTAQTLYPGQSLYTFQLQDTVTFIHSSEELYTDDVTIALDYSATAPSHGLGQGLNRIGNPTYTTINSDGLTLVGCDGLVYKYSEEQQAYLSIDKTIGQSMSLSSGEGFIVFADGTDPSPTATILQSAQTDSSLTITRSFNPIFKDVLNINLKTSNGYNTMASAIYDNETTESMNAKGLLNDIDANNQIGAPNIRIEGNDEFFVRRAFQTAPETDALHVQLRTPFAVGETFELTLETLGINNFQGQCVSIIDHALETTTSIEFEEVYSFVGTSDSFERRFSIVFSERPSAHVGEVSETICVGEPLTVVTESESNITFYLNDEFQIQAQNFELPTNLDPGVYTIKIMADAGCGPVIISELPLAVESCLGIEEHKKISQLWQSEENLLKIWWNNYSGETWRYSLYTTTGQLVASKSDIKEPETAIDVNSGIYILSSKLGTFNQSQVVVIK